MPFTHDMVCSLAAVADLVNSAPRHDSADGMTGLADLEDYVRRHAISGVDGVDEADLAQVRALRGTFSEILAAPDPATAVTRVNALLERTRITAMLTEHDGFPLHVHYFGPGASVTESLAADCGVALAHLLAESEWERLRTCAAPGCGKVFLDESRNRSRVYCDSRTCGNRMHVAAYRARRRA
ncbi:CGNR zinc finger domain-containing protein [Sphaerisporangium sp. TRM90804]|uniref:CGNR zinc finger domain-containing protein n=1 Tax=Sphaerisporangium sp. TRM90804 TaxID=3031113 RepID=UPI002447E5F6|nr:CGNR zinc finger domain-containing protein [Sphaerisporangium sp. TRM90804]MDH2425024.1 CGNR zinc finger domain-containing protein [Sphaerisporangium sp. TRM90804]